MQVDSANIAVEKESAEAALAEAIPILEEAAQALNDLKRDDITEIRSFAKPHILVQKVRTTSSACWVRAKCVIPAESFQQILSPISLMPLQACQRWKVITSQLIWGILVPAGV